MTLVPWSHGRSLLWDATCVDTLAPSRLASTSTKAGFAAAEAERKKKLKYASLTGRFNFVPLAFETLGQWGDDAKAFLADLGRRISHQAQDHRAAVFFVQRVALAIQRGNSASILGSLPRSRGLTELFLL
jgi:hypothetical protein